MFVGMNEFNPHIGIVFETDIIGDLEEKVVTTSGLESERHFGQTDFEVIFFRKPIPDPTVFEHKSTESRAVKPAIERLFQSKNEQVVLSSDETKEADTADEPVYITETQQMDLNDYQILQNKLYAVGREANKSVVSVKGIGQTTDWFDTEHVMENQGSAIILADTNGRCLIATERKLIAEAKKYEFASVCVNPTWVKTAADLLKDSSIKVCTVIGFPLGATTSSVKAFETRDAISMV